MTEFFGQPIKTRNRLRNRLEFWKGKRSEFKNINEILVERIEKLETKVKSLEKYVPCVCTHCKKPAIVGYDAIEWDSSSSLVLLSFGWVRARVVLHQKCIEKSDYNRRVKDRRAKSVQNPNDRRVADRRQR